MIAEVFPQAYDAVGKKVFRPDQKRRGLRPTAPMGRYIQAPLTVQCHSIEDVRRFLCQCKGVSDKQQFGKEDYWSPPRSIRENQKRRLRGFCPVDLEAVHFTRL
jgi:predicted transglutaminase-like cysteine proteinase